MKRPLREDEYELTDGRRINKPIERNKYATTVEYLEDLPKMPLDHVMFYAHHFDWYNNNICIDKDGSVSETYAKTFAITRPIELAAKAELAKRGVTIQYYKG